MSLNKLLKFVLIANSFDRRHLFAAADIVDELIQKLANDINEPHKKAAKLIREKRSNKSQLPINPQKPEKMPSDKKNMIPPETEDQILEPFVAEDDLEDKTSFKLSVRDSLVSISAKYQGKTVKLNDPVRNPPGSNKKFHVFVKDKSGKVKKVQFGDPKMEIKRDDPKRRKSFRARHNCENAKDKTKAKYWSCYQWRKNKKVDN